MVGLNFITDAQAQAAKKEKLTFKESLTQEERFAYYLNYVVGLMQAHYSEDQVWKDGMRVYTNLDPVAQVLADKTLSQKIKSAPNGISQGALVSISVRDGGVLAMVGGVGTFEKSPWNRAVNPHTAGSAFKPFVYLTGLMTGVLKPDSTIDDAPLSIRIPGTNQIYSPKNFENDYLGTITIRKALALSRNTCSVRVAQAVGPQAIADTASKAGVTSKLDPTLSLALGASAVSPLDMANSYATLARGGVRTQPIFIRRVEDKDGHQLVANNPIAERVFPLEPDLELVDALQDVVEHGTGTHAQLLGRPVAGKTGTADGAKDIWFIGFTPDVVTAVWGGNDKHVSVSGKQVTGGSIMAGIWQQYMQAYYASHPTPPGTFAAPANPLAEEVEAIHFLPHPAGIFDKIVNFFNPDNDQPRPAPSYSGGSDMAPAVAPERVHFGSAKPRDAHSDRQPAKKGGVKRLFKKMFGFLH
jgi:membrane peptidoglycan carboxypeptidase